jgi:hypothetical protein
MMSYVSALVDVFCVSSSGGRDARTKPGVDSIDAPERIDIYLVVGEGLVGAWLEGYGITSRINVVCYEIL